MQNFFGGPEIPVGFGMALSQNMGAMNHFASLTDDERKDIIARTHDIQSDDDMRAYVESLIQ